MTVIKQKTVGNDTIQLKQLKNDTNFSDNQYKYVVENQKGERYGDPVFTRTQGMQEFKETVSALETTQKSKGQNNPGFLSGGGFSF